MIRRAPGRWPLVGHVPAFLRDKLGFLSACAADRGDVVELHLGQRTYLLNDPDDIGHVLVGKHANYEKTDRLTNARGKRLAGTGLLTASSSEHGRRRRVLRPVFHREILAGFADAIVANTERRLAEWGDHEIDIEAEMASLTRQNVMGALFGVDTRREASALSAAIRTRQRYIAYVFGSLLPRPELWPTPVRLRYLGAIRQLDAFIYREIRARRNGNNTASAPEDMLAMLLAARFEDGGGMSDREVRDEALTFAITGYETIGEALTWTVLLLSQNPAAETRVKEELGEVLGGRLPEAADVPRLKYLSMVLAESMRLYPPTWIQVRVASNGDRLPSGALIPAGAKLYLCQWVTHRTASHHPEPERFEPRRHAEPIGYHKYAYFPFGLGPRRCIGENYALMQGVLVLATILRRNTIVLAPGQRITPDPGIILRPRDGLRGRPLPAA